MSYIFIRDVKFFSTSGALLVLVEVTKGAQLVKVQPQKSTRLTIGDVLATKPSLPNLH